MQQTHRVIIIPGLGDQIREVAFLTSHWRRCGLIPVVHGVGWWDRERTFEPKLMRLVRLIDRYVKQGDRVSLVGASAGGSAVVNAFFLRRRLIHKVISICGRLRRGNEKGFRSFAARTASSPAFAESVLGCERAIDTLSADDRKRIMTVRPLLGDELVPADTAVIEGANNITVPSIEHVISIAASLTIFSTPLLSFLQQEKRDSF